MKRIRSTHALIHANKMKVLIAGIFLTFTFSSCVENYGHNGHPGRSYLGLTWDIDEPDYIDAGTNDIPPVFEWGSYYRAYPGYYTLYYDGEVWNGYHHSRYAWEIDYEIWNYPGEPGGPGYNGYDGMDTYFTLVCSPTGPQVYTDEQYKKTETTAPDPDKIELNKPDTIVVTKNNSKIRIIYKKVSPVIHSVTEGNTASGTNSAR